MSDINKKAISEVLEVLKNSEEDIEAKIPNKFMTFLKENADLEYIPNIDFSKENWENSIEEDARAMLALIYRDYLVDEDERRKIIQEEQEEQKKEEEELRERYNPDNLFKKDKKEENISKEVNVEEPKALIEVKEKWYTKIWNKLKALLKIRHNKD